MAHEFNSNHGGAVRPGAGVRRHRIRTRDRGRSAAAGPHPPASTAPAGTVGSGSAGRKAATDYADYRLVPARHPWRWVGTAVVALGVAGIAWSLATNPRWEWGVVAQWFTAQSIVNGLLETLKLTAISGALGFILGFILALMRLSASPAAGLRLLDASPGSSAPRRCWCRCCSGTTWATSTRRSAWGSRSRTSASSRRRPPP